MESLGIIPNATPPSLKVELWQKYGSYPDGIITIFYCVNVEDLHQIHSYIFSNSLTLLKMVVDLEYMLGTPCVRQEYTLYGKPVYCRALWTRTSTHSLTQPLGQ